MGKNVAEVSGLRSTKSNTNSVKTVTKTAPSVILSDTAQRRLSAKSLRNPIWHAICISVSENINKQVKNKKTKYYGKDYWNRLRYYKLLCCRI